jgi:hypothetical protein
MNAAEVCVRVCTILANTAGKLRSAPITDQQTPLSISTNIVRPTDEFHYIRSEEFFCRTKGRSICAQKPEGGESLSPASTFSSTDAATNSRSNIHRCSEVYIRTKTHTRTLCLYNQLFALYHYVF